MQVRVLGASAGGGFPQWNCNCTNCRGFIAGSINATQRTQSSIAVSNDEKVQFALLNASPDVGHQLREWPKSQPGRGVRDTAIAGVILVDSQIDHSVGLLSLREAGELSLYCTDAVYEDLSTQLPIVNVLRPYATLRHHPIAIEPPEAFLVKGVDDLRFMALAVVGKAPPYCQHSKDRSGHNIAIKIIDEKKSTRLLYAPGLQEFDASFEAAVSEADCVMIDGTFWTDDEMAKEGISQKTAKQMGHLQLSGAGGIIEHLKKFPSKRRIFIHINNTNPILNADSEQKRMLDDLGIEVAFDGMELDI